MRLRAAIVLPAIALLNAAAWAVALAAFPAPVPPLRVAAEYLSTTVILIMSTNLVLATRPVVLEKLFDGLDKMFASHRMHGVTAAILIMGHATLIPKSPGWVAPKLVAYPTITLVLISVALAIAPRSPWRKLVTLRYDHWKIEHRFMGVFVAAAVTHSVLARPLVLSLPLVRVWVYGVVTIGLLAYVFRETLEGRFKERHIYRVGTPLHVAKDVLEIPLEASAHSITHRPGQFAFVRFEGGPSREQHPFTISQHPSRPGLRFSVKGTGDYTKELQAHLATGTIARIEGPYGTFDYTTGGRRQLWLAGGIGITPFLPFVSDVGTDRDVRFIWTVRDPADAPYVAEIERALADKPNVRFSLRPTCSEGHLRLSSLALERLDELDIYICGPVRMRDAFLDQLAKMGVSRKRIHYEEFSLR